MKDRIGRLVGESEARNLMMGTFHSIFARILRIEADRINYPSNFTIYDTQDSKSLLKDIIKGMGLDDKEYKVSTVANRISGAKNNLIDAATYMNHAEIQAEDRQSGKPQIGNIFKAYENRCFRAGAMDFDDLLFKMNVLLRDNADLSYKVSAQVPIYNGGRVSGYELCPIPYYKATSCSASECVCCG